MELYINKEDIVKELKERSKLYGYGSSLEAVYKKQECDDILSFLDTLEIKDFDEIIKTAEDHAYFAGSENAREKLIDNNISLFTDVDEAAKEYLLSIDAYKNTDYGCKFDQFDIETFKAGAEWMAKQGETLYDTINVDGKNQRWLGENLLQGEYDAGQAVIVQIRKV